jgi:alcohol dehydrogenase class IV
VRLARQTECELVIGFGGGSVIDAAKAIAAMLTNPGELLDYMEVIGQGKPLVHRSAPFIAVPTTSGTGSEVTRNAVLDSPEHHVKVSMRSPLMLPHIALVDPELTHSAPPAITASAGLDALTQVIEPYVSKAANPFTDAVCREGILRAARSLKRACQNGDDADARLDMSVASLFGGIALANAKLGAVHGFAGVLGGTYHAPHGAICACLLPIVTQVNIRLLEGRSPDSPALERYAEVAHWLTGNPNASLQDGMDALQELVQALEIPRLSAYGLKTADFPAIIEQASKASSMKGNPVQLSPQEMEEILRLAL